MATKRKGLLEDEAEETYEPAPTEAPAATVEGEVSPGCADSGKEPPSVTQNKPGSQQPYGG